LGFPKPTVEISTNEYNGKSTHLASVVVRIDIGKFPDAFLTWPSFSLNEERVGRAVSLGFRVLRGPPEVGNPNTFIETRRLSLQLLQRLKFATRFRKIHDRSE
jgi:hypothetical protein